MLDRWGAKSIELVQLRAMVIDDNRDMRSLVKSLLCALGIKDVVECGDGAEALQELKIRKADIILLDWEMEPIDGIEFLKLLRQAPDSPCPRANVIMLTANTTAEHVIEARNAGMTEFLAKPLSAEKLYTRVMSVLKYPRPFISEGDYIGPCRRRRFPGGYEGTERRGDSEVEAA